MKKKVLFYGNCQLGVLSNMFQLQNPKFNEEYEVLKASDYNLPFALQKEVGVVANWILAADSDINETIKSTNKITEDADIIIFQRLHKTHTGDRPEEFTTDYIYQKHQSSKQIICLPSFWFSGYLSDPFTDNLITPYIFKWLLDKRLSNKQIFDWLKNESHPNISLLIERNAQESIKEHLKREIKESSLYKNFISALDILPHYRNNFLCYNHSHPAEFYYKQIYYKIIELIDNKLLNDILDENILPAGPNVYPYPLDFFWFRENFPKITNCNLNIYTQSELILTQDFVNKQVEGLKMHELSNSYDSTWLKNYLDILNL